MNTNDNVITTTEKPKIKKIIKKKYKQKVKIVTEKPITIDDLIYVVGKEANTKIKRTFLKTIKYQGDIRRAMKEEGYSENQLLHPERVRQSKDWQEALDHYFPPNEIIAMERKLWKQKDWRAWANSLDRIAKMKGHFVKKTEQTIHKVTEYRNHSDKDLQNIIDADYEDVPKPGADGGQEGTRTEGDVTQAS